MRRAGATRPALTVAVLLAVVSGACVASGPTAVAPRGSADAPVGTEVRERPPPVAVSERPTAPPRLPAGRPRPDWLGTRALPLAADGFGVRLPTPTELIDRRLHTPPIPEPAPVLPTTEGFTASIDPVPDLVLARSTWRPDCPVTVAELRYVTAVHVGFDEFEHVGELIVHADVAHDVVAVLAALHDARFPIEELRVIGPHELDAPPTGDGNVTSAFVCRRSVTGTRWSEHAFGRAIDINPFHNPYVRGELVLPELAGAYRDRADLRPGMIVAGDVVTGAFRTIGWGWGGDWSGAATDPMHFSASGR